MPSRRDTLWTPVNSNSLGRFLTMEQVAAELGVAVAQTYALLRTGALSGIKNDGRAVWRGERTALETHVHDAYQLTQRHVAEHPLYAPGT